MITAQSIISFWFSENVKPLWYNSTPEFDQQLREKYLDVFYEAREGKLANWQNSAEGSLALVIILDQFPLNMFRHDKESFSSETQSIEVAQQALDQHFDDALPDEQKAFLYLPFMHSEDLRDQDRSVMLFKNAKLNENLKFAEHHRRIIQTYGRFPHRNAILGRTSTEDELAYLKSDEAFLG